MAGAALAAEVANPGAHRVVGDTVTLGGGVGGEALDKKGVQGGEAAVQGLAGFEEEAARQGIVHDGLRSEGGFLAVGRAVE